MNKSIEQFLEAHSEAIKVFRTAFERLLLRRRRRVYTHRVWKECSRQKKIVIVSYLKGLLADDDALVRCLLNEKMG